jgi:competence protein ComEA
VVLLALLALVGPSVVGGRDAAQSEAATVESVELVEVSSATEDDGGTLLVHVAGAVREPGVYELAPGSRVADAVERAGGPRARAALESINLAAELLDGQQVVVPLRAVPGQTGQSPAAGDGTAATGFDRAGSSGPAAAGGGLISLSSASATELQELPGVGPVTAERIIAHREEHGPFRAVDELAAVSGIGTARIEAIRDLVTP